MKTIYATEPVMHDGEVYLPGQPMDCDDNEAAAIIGSGRGTQDQKIAADAKKQYAQSQAAAAEAEAAAKQSAADSGASVTAAAASLLAAVQAGIAAAAPAAK